MLGIIKKKAQKAHSIIKKINHNTTKPRKVNSGWQEIVSAPKESAAIHKETASGWELVTKRWKKTPQPTPKPPPKIEKKTLTSPIPEKLNSAADAQTPVTPVTPVPKEPVAKPKSTDKSTQTAVTQPTAVGRRAPVADKTDVLQAEVKPKARPTQKSGKQLHPRFKPPLAKSKKNWKKSQTPTGTPDVNSVTGKLSDGWEELAAGWGQAPDGWDVEPPHHDDPDDTIELNFRKNVHTLSKILKEMADELFLAIQQRDDQILFVRTELEKYKSKARRLELTVQQQWDEEVLRVRDKEIAKARNELKIYKAKAGRLEKTLAIQDEYTYERILVKYDLMVRDILVKRTLNNEQKMRHLMLIGHHLGIPHGEAIRIIRDKVNKIMAQVNRL